MHATHHSRGLALAIGALALAASAIGCPPPPAPHGDTHNNAANGDDANAAQHMIAARDIALLERASAEVRIPVTGFFRAARHAQLQADEAGAVVALGDPDAGDYQAPGELRAGTLVEAGAVLITLRNLKLEADYVALERAYESLAWGMDDPDVVNELEAAYDSALSAHERQTSLAARNATTADRIEAARQAFESANAALEKARAEVLLLARQLEALQRRVDALTIRAPFAGRISAVAVEVGEYVSAAGTVVTLVDDRQLDFACSVAEAYGPHIQPGESTVRVQLPDGAEIECAIRSVDPVVDPQTRSVRTTARLTRKLLADLDTTIPVDAFGRATLQFVVDGVFAPSRAVQVREGRTVLIVADETRGALQVVPVSIGVIAGERTQILGMAARTPVATRPQSIMTDGDSFRISGRAAAVGDNDNANGNAATSSP